jgi:hypothetical protein
MPFSRENASKGTLDLLGNSETTGLRVAIKKLKQSFSAGLDN